MSSPIASGKSKKRPLGDVFVSVHQSLSHSHRISILTQQISRIIERQCSGSGELRCLDVGCGDMKIAEEIGVLSPRTQWTCIDIHELPEELVGQKRWLKYRTFDGVHIPFPDDTFDVVLCTDVLHHVETNVETLLAEAGRTGKVIVVKDHFEYSFVSRAALWAMDFIGNWGYGVALPSRYFSRDSFALLLNDAGLRCRSMTIGIDLYAHIPLVRHLLRKEWQFLAVLDDGGGE